MNCACVPKEIAHLTTKITLTISLTSKIFLFCLYLHRCSSSIVYVHRQGDKGLFSYYFEFLEGNSRSVPEFMHRKSKLFTGKTLCSVFNHSTESTIYSDLISLLQCFEVLIHDTLAEVTQRACDERPFDFRAFDKIFVTTLAVNSKEASIRREVWFYGIYNYHFYKVCDCDDL